MRSIYKKQGGITEEPQEILKEVNTFYTNLYTEEAIDHQLLDDMLNKLNKKVTRHYN